MTGTPRPDALFRERGGIFVPTERTQGPWEAGFQFGGAPAALIAHVVHRRVPTLTPMHISRLTVDLLRPVPIAPLEVHTHVRREGKRIQVVDVSVTADGTEVVAARVLRVRRADLSTVDLPRGPRRAGPPAVPRFEHRPPPEHGVPNGTHGTLEYALEPGMTIFRDPTWARLAADVVEGEPTDAVERMAYVADACSGFGHPFDQPVSGINADITLTVVRPCDGEWLHLEGGGWTGRAGVGWSQVTLSDELGVVGGVTLTRLVDPA